MRLCRDCGLFESKLLSLTDTGEWTYVCVVEIMFAIVRVNISKIEKNWKLREENDLRRIQVFQ